VELETIIGLFRNLDGYLEQLQRLAAQPRDALKGDPILLGAAKYYLQVAIECCVDVANHIVARQGFRAPESYADSFTVLAEEGVIPADFLSTAHRMARLRNRLVHLYWEVDPDQLYEILQHDLGDFGRFRAAICGFVQRLQPRREEG